jgi:hypothetical protein
MEVISSMRTRNRHERKLGGKNYRNNLRRVVNVALELWFLYICGFNNKSCFLLSMLSPRKLGASQSDRLRDIESRCIV